MYKYQTQQIQTSDTMLKFTLSVDHVLNFRLVSIAFSFQDMSLFLLFTNRAFENAKHPFGNRLDTSKFR